MHGTKPKSETRVRCRNLRCRLKLSIPTDNEHQAFCCRGCYDQFYKRRCLVCEKELPEGYRRQLCSSPECKRDWRNFRHTYAYQPNRQTDSRSACAAGVKSALRAPPGARIIAGPALSEFSLWAATLDPPKPQPLGKPAWHQQHPPGHIAAEWTARELERREAEDAQYVAEDEARLRSLSDDDGAA